MAYRARLVGCNQLRGHPSRLYMMSPLDEGVGPRRDGWIRQDRVPMVPKSSAG